MAKVKSLRSKALPNSFLFPFPSHHFLFLFPFPLLPCFLVRRSGYPQVWG